MRSRTTLSNYATIVVLIGATLLCDTVVLAQVEVDWVVVGDAGNVGELSGEGAGGIGPDRICGAVDYVYRIAKYEVTNGQYIECLNSIATVEDTLGLFEEEDPGDNGGMDGPYGGIERLGNPGNYSYRAKAGDPNWLDKPVHFISFYDALRFANWMHNGQPGGLQDAGTTENGAYDMSLAADLVRLPGARVFLPNEDEWHKAAFYKGGVSAGYWDYATQADTTPVAEPPPGRDDPPGSANYSSIGLPYYATDVGAYTWSPSHYGTFSQAGNVHEWTETAEGEWRVVRGGGWPDGWAGPAAARIPYVPEDYEYLHTGFRLASVQDAESVPAVSEWGVAVMTLLLLSGATIVLARVQDRQLAHAESVECPKTHRAPSFNNGSQHTEREK